MDRITAQPIHEEQEPEDFAECLIRTNAVFPPMSNTMLSSDGTSSNYNAESVQGKKIIFQSNAYNSATSTPYPVKMATTAINTSKHKEMSALPTQKAKKLNHAKRDNALHALSTDLNPIYGATTKLPRTATMTSLLAEGKKKSQQPYKIFSKLEGAFAFRSEADFQQPFYPLKFEEHDLAYQLDLEELEGKKYKRKGDMMILAMRQKLKQSVEKSLKKQRDAMAAAGSTSASKEHHTHHGVTPQNVKQLVSSTTADAKKQSQTPYEQPIRMYPLNKVRYNNDEMFPFELLCDVPRSVKKALEAINLSTIYAASKTQASKPYQEAGANSAINSTYYQADDPDRNNELLKFLQYNEYGFNNLVVYLFWIILSNWFSDYDHLNLPPPFLMKVREALHDQYRAIYFRYLIRLRQQVMDSIIDILPFLLAELMRNLIQSKLRNHELPLQLNKTFLLLIAEVYRELYGFETSELSLEQQKKLYVKSFAERIKDSNKKRNQQNNNLKRSSLKLKADKESQENSEKGDNNQHAQSNAGSQTGSKVNNSIFAVGQASAKKLHTDPEYNDKDYSVQIKQDMVNEMIHEWGKISSNEAKMSISDQINALKNVPTPQKFIQVEASKQTSAIGLHEMSHSKRKGQFMKFEHSSTILPTNSSLSPRKLQFQQKRTLTKSIIRVNSVDSSSVGKDDQHLSSRHTINQIPSVKAQLSKTRSQASLFQTTPKQREDFIGQAFVPSIDQMSHSPIGEVIEDCNLENMPSHLNSSFRRHEKSSAVQNTQRSLSKKSRSRSKTKKIGRPLDSKGSYIKVNHFKKSTIKTTEFVPQEKDMGLERLKQRIILSRKKEEAYMKQQEFKPEESVGLLASSNHQHSKSTSTVNFDLQHVSPIIQGKFPNQLHMHFDERRKQKKMSIQGEPDYERVENYKIMQYELKQEIKERDTKEKERIEKMMSEKRAQIMRKRMLSPDVKNLTNETIESSKQGSKTCEGKNPYQMSKMSVFSSGKRVDEEPDRLQQYNNHAIQEYQSLKKFKNNQKQKPFEKLQSSMKTPNKAFMMQSVSNSGTIFNTMTTNSPTRDATLCQTVDRNRTDTNYSRNVRFQDNSETRNSENISINVQIVDEQSPGKLRRGRTSTNLTQNTSNMATPVKTKEMFLQTPQLNNEAFFFDKQEFFRGTAPHETEQMLLNPLLVDKDSKKSTASSKANINYKMLTSTDDLTQIPLAMEKHITPQQRVVIEQKANELLKAKNMIKEKNQYDHQLMINVKQSIRQSKSLVNDAMRSNSLQSSVQESGQGLPRIKSMKKQTGSVVNKTAVKDQNSKDRAESKASRSSPSQSDKKFAVTANLPPLSTDQLNMKQEAANTQKQDHRSKQGGSLIAGIRTKPGTVSFDARQAQQLASKHEGDELVIPLPFTEEDASKQLFRKTTKILSKGKYKVVNDGTKKEPLHKQLVDYIKQYPEKTEDYDKMLMQEFIRRRMKNILPAHLQMPQTKNSFKTPPPPDYLASKHTYASMRKISNMKSRKQFVFDDYDIEQKRMDAQSLATMMPTQAARMARQSRSTTDLQSAKTEEAKKPPVHPYLVKGANTESSAALKLNQTSQAAIDKTAQQQANVVRSYHIYKGSNYGKNKTLLVNMLDEDGHALKAVDDSKKATPSQASAVRQSERNSVQIRKQGSNMATQAENNRNLARMTPASRDIRKKDSATVQSELCAMTSDGDSLDSEQRREEEEWLRQNQILNENDDKADVRDGIAETKGKVLRASGEDQSRPQDNKREKNQKLYRMLNEMRSTLSKEDERKKEAKIRSTKAMEVVESDEEKERLDEMEDIYEARPNPLELQPKPKMKPIQAKKKPQVKESAKLDIQKKTSTNNVLKNDFLMKMTQDSIVTDKSLEQKKESTMLSAPKHRESTISVVKTEVAESYRKQKDQILQKAHQGNVIQRKTYRKNVYND